MPAAMSHDCEARHQGTAAAHTHTAAVAMLDLQSIASRPSLQLMSLDAPQQREKLVASLKDQIKKLQKDRDKIKTWYASNVSKMHFSSPISVQ